MSAIETVYNGYRFRSRLEARWAVFFDALGVKYEYEKEGYKLGDGLYYLPDFWLPVQKTWVEVKPTHPSDKEDEKAEKLASATDSKVIIVVGQPWCDRWTSGYDGGDSGYIFWPGENGEPGGWDNFYMLTVCRHCGAKAFVFSGYADRIPCACDNGKKDEGDWDTLYAAMLRARQARFEHGETPAPYFLR